ncbi:RNA polymerase sigma-70 factor (ECF subfamily) [Paenibacillus sp. DS2015]|uniref:RNA polymerase sigma factor n=1 Tax=Paenibacillus sp. DS2015 TaxID=3373917 RepID=UPI003D1F7F49
MTDHELFQKYNKDVYKTCYYMLHNASDAEDVCHDVFITVFRQDWRRIEYINTWLIRVTVNQCLNHLKRSRSLRMKEQMNQRFSRESLWKTVDSVIEERETAEEWSGFMSQLPYKIRVAVSLRYVNDFSLTEISEILQIPLGTVKSRLHKGMRMMRKVLIENGYEDFKEEKVDGKRREDTLASLKR